MPVTIKGLGSNKALQKPKSPDEALFKYAIQTASEAVIWRSIPQPDRIAFATLLTEEHFGKTGSKKSVLDKSLIAQLAQGLGGAVNYYTGKAVWAPPNSFPRKFTIPFGPREAQAFITLERRKSKEAGHHWLLRAEFSPRKLQPNGHEELLYALHHASPSPFDVPALLRDARVQRLDVAIDLFGVDPSDLLATATVKGKRQEVYGPDGRLESLYLYRPKKVPKAAIAGALKKPFGALALRVYDRNRERAARGKPPPYPGGTTARLEASVVRFPKATYLPQLPLIQNPFRFSRVSLAADVMAPVTSDWQRYWAARRTFGADGAKPASGLSIAMHHQLDGIVEENPSTLLPQETLWLDWPEGIHSCSLSALLDAADSSF